MTNKKADAKTSVKKNTTAGSETKKQTTPDIFSLSEPTSKKTTVKKEAAKTGTKTATKKVEPKKEAKKSAKVAPKKESKPAVKTAAKPKKAAPKKVAKTVAAKKTPVKVTEKKVAAAKKEVNNAVNSLFDVAANIFGDINDNMWTISKDVTEQRFKDLTSAFDKVEDVMKKADSIVEEDKKNRKAIEKSSDVLSKKSQELNEEIITFCEQVFDNHMENTNLLLGCSNLEDLHNARCEMYERDISRLFDIANRNANIWFGMIEDSCEPLQKRADEISEKIIFRIL